MLHSVISIGNIFALGYSDQKEVRLDSNPRSQEHRMRLYLWQIFVHYRSWYKRNGLPQLRQPSNIYLMQNYKESAGCCRRRWSSRRSPTWVKKKESSPCTNMKYHRNIKSWRNIDFSEIWSISNLARIRQPNIQENYLKITAWFENFVRFWQINIDAQNDECFCKTG